MDSVSIAALMNYGAETAAGIFVSPMAAMDCPPAEAASRIRCDVLGTLSLKLFKRDGDANVEATDHPLYRLLKDRPNPWTSASAFVSQMEQDTIFHGHGYAFANRIRGEIVELIRLHPQSVSVKYDAVTQEPSYTATLKSGPSQTYAWQDILHVSSWDGQSAIRKARNAIGLSMALERHASHILSRGARPSGIFKSPKKFSDVAYERLKKSWNGAHTGDNAGGTVILEEMGEFQSLQFSSVDMQFNELRQFQILEIGRALGIPPPMMYELGRATYSNAAEMAQAFLSFTMLGRCKLWEGAISRLLTEDEQAIYYPEFLTDTLVRADLAARFTAYAQACGGPWMTPDEIRGLDNYSPVAGGDKLRPPANAVGVTDGSKPEPTPRPKPALVSA